MNNKKIFRTQGVCAQAIAIELDSNNTVVNIEFMGGCSGNTQGVAKLAKGMKASDVIASLEGISCNGKPTSCPDQLARALKMMTE
ncbi:MAG: TIGR03905 family TSCPD domain-containing protein [Bacteroidales bacterium]|nr:TIGR03905 family TSCPD domain-containing protein [Bacteroidales bacterium]